MKLETTQNYVITLTEDEAIGLIIVMNSYLPNEVPQKGIEEKPWVALNELFTQLQHFLE